MEAAFGEPVSEADIFHLAMDGRLVLSVNFVNPGMGRPGDVVQYTAPQLVALVEAGIFPEDLSWTHHSPESVKALRAIGFTYIPEACEAAGYSILMSQRLDNQRLLTLSDSVTRLDGVYDLPMVGAERLDVEHAYQRLTGGPEVTSVFLDGALVEDTSGRMYNVLDRLDDEDKPGSPGAIVAIERRIKQEKLPEDMASRFREEYATDRMKFREDQRKKGPLDGYFPAGGLPEDTVFVVRASALSRFLDDVSGRTEEKALTTKERNVLLCMIAALANEAKIDIKRPSKAADLIRDIAHQKLGVAIGETTIEAHLKRIPDALETRAK